DVEEDTRVSELHRLLLSLRVDAGDRDGLGAIVLLGWRRRGEGRDRLARSYARRRLSRTCPHQGVELLVDEVGVALGVDAALAVQHLDRVGHEVGRPDGVAAEV